MAVSYEPGNPRTDLREVLTGEKPFERDLADQT